MDAFNDLTVGGRFAATASTYDRGRRQLIPFFDRFYGTAVDQLMDHPNRPNRVLELGAGTGLLSAMVAAALPGAELVLTDLVPQMLAQARARLADHPNASFVEGSFADGLPPGPFGAVVSGLAIHHLNDDHKRRLFGRIYEELAPGGIFINAEQVAAPTNALDELQAMDWRRQVRAAGVTETDLAAADTRMAADICAPVGPQLDWLSQVGFVDCDNPFRDGRFAVLVARKGD